MLGVSHKNTMKKTWQSLGIFHEDALKKAWKPLGDS